jgi:Putative Ig domain
MAVIWETPSGFLFTTTINDVVGVSVTASNATSYKIISGSLPEGLSLSSQGQISGTTSYVENSTQTTFVVRASTTGTVRDRTFYIDVYKSNNTSWSTDGFNFSNNILKKLLVNNEFVNIQLNANVDHPVTYYIDKSSGRLPFGMTMDSTGKITGLPKLMLAPSHAVAYTLDIVATDGVVDHRQTFTFDVIDSSSFTVDNSNLVLGGQTIGLLDLGNTGTVTLSSLQAVEFVGNLNLDTVLANETQFINVSGFDPDPGKGPVQYTALDSLPSGLSLDPSLGYLYGQLNPQTDYSHDYSFRVRAIKTDIVLKNTVSSTGTYTIQVVNQWYNNVVWPSSDLGVLTEGLTSELSVAASQIDNSYNLGYYLVPYSELPSGLTLSTSTGHLIGSATTSGNFSFTIAASTASYAGLESHLIWPVISHPVSFNTFSLKVKPVSHEYTSIWAEPFLTMSQRSAWETFINDTSIFLPNTIYRADDPSFGVQTDLRVFLEFGIEKVNLSDYAQSLYQNLYLRRLSFGIVKSAIAKDSQGNHLYDAVYVDIVDNLDGAKTPIVINGTTYYPGSIDFIRNSLESIVLEDSSEIAVDGYSLPKFMTTVAGDQPYGYFKAAVLCYTLPGESPKILNRIKAADFNFDNLDFFIDRLIVQNSLDNTGTSYISFNTQPIG